MDIASYSSDSRAVIKIAKEVAAEFKHAEIEVEHLLVATVRQEGTEVECSIYPPEERRHPPRSSITGRPMKRAGAKQLRRMIDASA